MYRANRLDLTCSDLSILLVYRGRTVLTMRPLTYTEAFAKARRLLPSLADADLFLVTLWGQDLVCEVAEVA